MFVFNRYDYFNNEYVCVFANGTHHVHLMRGRDDSKEVFTGNYESCKRFVDEKCLDALEERFR